MASKITLKVIHGEVTGKSAVYDEPGSCIVGRHEECNIHLPDKTVSRHHCLFDINPPDITIRDFGSMNGTYLNGNKIGQRESGMTPEEGQQIKIAPVDSNIPHPHEIQIEHEPWKGHEKGN